jgi:hypothetical protein
MAELDKLAGPVMRRAARLHANQARRQFGKEWQHLRTSKRLADNDPTGRINAVNLKNALGQIEADCGNLHDGWLPFARECLIAFTPWHLAAVSGSHPPHLLPGVNRKTCARGEYFRLISDIGPSRGVALYVLMKPI